MVNLFCKQAGFSCDCFCIHGCCGVWLQICGCPLYWKAPMFNASGGERAGCVSVHSFVSMWRKWVEQMQNSFWKKRTACHRSRVFFHQTFPIIFFLRVEKMNGLKIFISLSFLPSGSLNACFYAASTNLEAILEVMRCFDWYMKSINTLPRNTLGIQIRLIDVSGFWIFISALIAATLVHLASTIWEWGEEACDSFTGQEEGM